MIHIRVESLASKVRQLSLRCAALFCAITISLACANTTSAQIWVEQSTTRFPQPDPLDYTNQLTIGDLDADGDLDIVWANGGGFSSAGTPQVARIYINNGAGVFTDESAARGAAVGIFRGAELGDIENDGDLDIILAQDFNRQPILLVNNALGVFTDGTTARLPAITLSCTRAQFGDIDNDGDLDLYLTNGGAVNRFGAGQNKIYVNNGAGVFTDDTAARHPVAVLAEPMDAIFGDIDGDFDLDVRAASTGVNLSRLYRNNGAGVFSTVAGVPNDRNAYSYDFGDIDGDGDLDLFGANASPTSLNAEFLLRNDGTGAYTDISANISPNPTVDDNDSKFLDYDNDGDLDLIVARLGGTAERIYNNNGVGVFTEVTGLITALSDSTLDLKVADLNGDGRLDIVTGQGESGSFRNRVYMNTTGPADTRAPTIRTEQLANTTVINAPYVVRAAILDGMTSDRNFFDKGVELHYSVEGGPYLQTPMRYSGGQIYRGTIPAEPCGGVVMYYVVATDFANNTATSTTKAFTISSLVAMGDFDADGDVDEVDGSILAAVLLGTDLNPAHLCRADLNADFNLDGLDIRVFVDLVP